MPDSVTDDFDCESVACLNIDSYTNIYTESAIERMKLTQTYQSGLQYHSSQP